MGSYLINTSPNAAITVNLIQGRVLLEPLSYCELHNQDKARAKQIYNSKELNLFVAESEKELELILKNKETLQKIEIQSESTTETEDAPESEEDSKTSEDNTEDSSEETNNQNNNTEETVTTAQDETPVTTPTEETVVTESGDPEKIEESKETEKEESPEEDQKAKNRQQIVDAINIYRSQGNLRALKEMATKLGIHFMHNIGFNALTLKIMEHIDHK